MSRAGRNESGNPGRDDVVFAVDLGTGGPKVAYVTLGGEVLDHEHRRVDTRVLPGGGAVQDPDHWWRAVQEGAAALADRRAAPPDRVIAVAVTGQWGSTVPVDEGGAPVGDCILWMDRRGRDLARRQVGGPVAVEGFAPHKAYWWITRAGGAPSPEGNDPLGQRLWIEHEQPGVYQRTATFVEPIDHLNWRFTGRVSATAVTMLLSWLTDNRRLGVTDYDPRLVALAGADPDRLPPLVPVASTVGPLLSEVASDLGLPAGIPVVTGLPDLHSATLGTGAIDDFHAHVTISTSAWVGCHAPTKRTSLTRQMATVPAALPGRYLLANNHETAGVCLEWLRDNVILADDGLTVGASADGPPGFAALDDVAATSTSGSGGVLFAPWLNGERSPVSDTDLRGSFHNLSLATSRADLVRSVLEGVAHNARWLLEASESVLRHPLRDLRLIGGGAQSDLWAQIHADVLGRPLTRVAQPLLANVRGAALFAGIVLGRLDPATAAAAVAVDRTFEPDPSSRETHEALHREFRRLYKSEHKMYRRLNR